MCDKPDISVVMANHNGWPHLKQAVDSILRQQEVCFELIVVDDGSTDASRGYLRRLALEDGRLRLIEQANAGLTASLILGCQAARGDYIARQDSDDYSLPERLLVQKQMLDRNPDIVFVSCLTNIVGPKGEFLYQSTRPLDSVSATQMLCRQRGGPVHGSVMMRRRAYESSGGYRSEFYFSQDNDLWLRLADQGGLMYAPEALYCLRIHPASISGSLHFIKVPFAEAVTTSFQNRKAGRSDQPVLDALKRLPTKTDDQSSLGKSMFLTNYFVGSLLLRNRDSRCLEYLVAALRERVFALKVLSKLPLALLLKLADPALE